MHADDRTIQAICDFSDGQGRSVGSEHAVGANDTHQVGEDGLLHAHFFLGAFHDQIAIAANVFLSTGDDLSQDSVSLFLSHLALSDSLSIASGQLVLMLLSGSCAGSGHSDIPTCLCENFADASTHGTSADNANFHFVFLLL